METISGYLDKNLTDNVKRVKGVGDVTYFGNRKIAFRLWLDPEKLEKGIKFGKLPADVKFALQTPVMVGELENQMYPITKGLEANQMVATTNLLNLKHGMPVQVQPAKAD